jgi:uncharacterized delta-60 repeat protein
MRKTTSPLRCEPLEDRLTPAAGDLDPTFGTGGRAVVPLDGGAGAVDAANAVVAQPDGKVVLAGYTDVGTTRRDLVVARLLADGQLDPAFGSAGRVVLVPATPPGALFPNGTATAVALQPDGKLVVAGFLPDSDLTVLRLNPDGSFDGSFGTGGRTVVALGRSVNPGAVAVLPDGRLLVAGTSVATAGLSNPDFTALRLNPDGSLDGSFGAGGLSVFGFDDAGDARSDGAAAVAVQPDGRIVLAGTSTHIQQHRLDFPGAHMALARLHPNGTLDSSFDGDGRLVVSFGLEGGIDRATAVALQPDGKIVVGGLAGYRTPFLAFDPLSDMAAVRLNPDGSFDATFDGDGKQEVEFDAGTTERDSRAVGVFVLPSGRIVLAGSALAPDGDREFAATRLNANGTVDTTFGTNGRALAPIDLTGTTSDRATAAATQTVGRLVIVGAAESFPPTGGLGSDAAVARLLAEPVEPGAVLVGGRPDGLGVVFNRSGAGLAVGPAVQFFPGFAGSVRTATADVTGDGVPDLIGGAGPGGGPAVAVIDGRTGRDVARFLAFEASFTGGVFVAAGDLDGDGRPEVVVTPDRGGGPVVAVYSGAALTEQARFFGIEDPAFRGGARPAVGDLTGDGKADLIVSAGFLGGPRIALYDGQSIATVGTPVKLRPDFFAFEPALRNGAFVAAGDVTGDGFAEVAFGGGPGGAPRVRLFDGKALLAAGPFNNLDEVPAAQRANFFAGDTSLRGGVRVALRDADGNGTADLLTGSGEGEPSRVRVYTAGNLLANPTPVADQEIDPFGAVLADGVFVG